MNLLSEIYIFEAQVKAKTDENGKYVSNSILMYFADIFYTKRNGFREFTNEEIARLSNETKQYLVNIYDTLKIKNENYERRTSPKFPNGVDSFYNKPIITENDKINAARIILSFDPRRGYDVIDFIEYPSQEVLNNLDQTFNGNSKEYKAEIN